MIFKTEKRPQGQFDVIALGSFGPSLAPFNPTKLLDPTVIGFDHPTQLGKFETGQLGHIQVIGGPIFNVVFCNHDLEYLDKAKAFQMNNSAGGRYID